MRLAVSVHEQMTHEGDKQASWEGLRTEDIAGSIKGCQSGEGGPRRLSGPGLHFREGKAGPREEEPLDQGHPGWRWHCAFVLVQPGSRAEAPGDRGAFSHLSLGFSTQSLWESLKASAAHLMESSSSHGPWEIKNSLRLPWNA